MTQKQADRKQRAELLITKRSERTAQEQIYILDQRLGKGIGAKKERMRLNQQLQSNGKKKVAI